MGKRVLTKGSSKRRINNRVRTFDGSQFTEIDYSHLWVRRRLGKHHHGLSWFYGSSKCARLCAINKGDINAKTLTWPIEERNGAAIQLALRNDVVSRGAQRKDDRRNRTHARSKCERILSIFKFGNRTFEFAYRWV